MQTLREQVIEFLKNQHHKTGKTPSIRNIRTGLGLSNRVLYEAFPGGKPEACAAAGIPMDLENSERLAKASQTLKVKRDQEQREREELRNLRQKETAVAREVKQTRAIAECRENIRKLEISLARTAEGRRQIFSSSQRLLEFSERMIDPETWKQFRSYCRSHNLDLAATLYEVAEPLVEFERDANEEDLDSYLGLKLDVFVMDREAESRQKTLQGVFDEFLRDFRCKCGRRVTVALFCYDGFYCPCGTAWPLKCPGCKHLLQLDESRNAFSCHHCGMSFEFKVPDSLRD